jgi:hypothetical protein
MRSWSDSNRNKNRKGGALGLKKEQRAGAHDGPPEMLALNLSSQVAPDVIVQLLEQHLQWPSDHPRLDLDLGFHGALAQLSNHLEL